MPNQNPTKAIKFLDRDPPLFPEELARQIADELFGLAGSFSLLDSERDQNFHVRTENDENYVLKISHVDEDPGVIDFQTQALLHIEEKDPTLPIPRVVLTKDGDPFTTVNGPDGVAHIVRTLTYLPGITPEDTEKPPSLWRNLGNLIGRMDIALQSFFHPHAGHELLWDMLRSTELRPHTEYIENTTARKNIENILDHFADVTLPRLKTLRHQVIHSDIHVGNILVDPDHPEKITGIIDFGDMLFGPLVVDVAVAADMDKLPVDGLIEALGALVSGYDNVLPLDGEEIDLIYDLVLTRMAGTATIVAWRKAMTPDQPGYLLESESRIWEYIANLLAFGREKVRDSLRMACKYPPYCPTVPEDDLSDKTEHLLSRRNQVLGKGTTLFYTRPLHVERGSGPWLYNTQGKAFLDAYNNVPIVGHSHPHVVKAISRQAAALNTNTRYLYQIIYDYGERLTSLLSGDLSVCLFVNSGSEANDVAWQIAQHITGNQGALIMEDAYHGVTETTAVLSPSDKERDLASHVQTLVSPDVYRGEYRAGEPNLVDSYAKDADRAISDLEKEGHKTGMFMVDTGFVSNGIPDIPEGYLGAVAAKVRAAGGLVVADEVQAGFGRLGTHMWGHDLHGLTPDIVTLGKPVGNGFPLGVVVSTPAIMDTFMKETALFSTFGGNPVACAAGMAVLDVIEDEDLLSNSQSTGKYLLDNIRGLMARHDWIGDVRGSGLLVGVELVRDRETKEPAKEETQRVLDLMKDNGVLIGYEGKFGNVLKIRPPLTFQPKHADILVEALDKSLEAL